jgi:putative Holliday junction resolvase
MKLLALDFGSKRLGLALCDDEELFALPHGTYNRKPNDNRGDIVYLVSLIKAQEIKGLVLGIPSGSENSDKTAAQARRFAENLRVELQAQGREIEIFEQDERFSTSLTASALRESGVSSKSARENGLFDAGAAAAFLQTFLDKRKAAQTNWDPSHEDKGLDDLINE